MKDRLTKSIKRLEKLKLIKEKTKSNFEKGLNSYEIKVFRQLREKYDLSLESIENTKEEETELSDEAKVTLERIKKGEVFTL
ncbi:MAG: hypothetical protein CMM92_00410 [Rickettsiales bacterium]|jgi:hypothetical protein|nr:hypothetical protein [Rickettsiales bacterium]RPG16187.1 MAG: hypothetical protein CBD55_000410 [Pelagibacteraceae bacterium TMED195]|tara:strand:+ start:107 stop:352 length:246 start_codon:yes stop_codon:yes gene_type:complete